MLKTNKKAFKKILRKLLALQNGEFLYYQYEKNNLRELIILMQKKKYKTLKYIDKTLIDEISKFLAIYNNRNKRTYYLDIYSIKDLQSKIVKRKKQYYKNCKMLLQDAIKNENINLIILCNKG